MPDHLRLELAASAILSLVAYSASAVVLAAASTATVEPRERVSLDADWRFQLGDAPKTANTLSYETLKPWILPTGDALLNLGSKRPASGPCPADGVPLASVGFDDRTWRKLDVPHDWGIEGPFRQDLPGESGKLPWEGVGWYRKHFKVPADAAGRRLYVDFDGAMSHAEVWLNGHFVGGWPYGYSSFRLELTPFAIAGGDNLLAVRLENPPESSRWYPGAGIYRNVWLVTEGSVHFAQWGIAVTTPRVSEDQALVTITVAADNETNGVAGAEIGISLYGADDAGRPKGSAVASVETEKQSIEAGKRISLSRNVEVAHPKLWSLENRFRYVAVTELRIGGSIVDRVETPFGIRTIRFDPEQGFLLNGKRVPLQGVCDHHDLGALGTAIHVDAMARQLTLLKEMGCNALRTSHNPPAPELLDLCDRMGILVMDEAFDCWTVAKKPNDYHLLFGNWHEKDLRALVRRDRNHPCIILWSIGNEVSDQLYPEVGTRVGRQLTGIVHEEDQTRPTVSAFNVRKSGYDGMQRVVDEMGYNYQPGEYGHFREVNPTIPLVATETASCVSTRGFYVFPVRDDKSRGRMDYQVSSYDLSAPPWATPPDTEFRGQAKAPFVAGEFVWTGFDYLGEPTPYGDDSKEPLEFSSAQMQAQADAERMRLGHNQVPSRSSYFGILDLAGLKKDRFYLYQAHWRPDYPMAHLVPHWTWPERVGQVTPVQVYTSGDEAELFLNGHSLGRKRKGPLEYRIRWEDVTYEPGELKVVAYRDGRPWATDVERTSGAATAVSLETDQPAQETGGASLIYVTAAVRDANGTLVPRASNRIHFVVEGPADVIAVDNGDPTSFAPFQARERDAFNGYCIAIVRVRAGAAGTLLVEAEAEGLAPGHAKIQLETGSIAAKAPPRPSPNG